jgi:hypothetical protein
MVTEKFSYILSIAFFKDRSIQIGEYLKLFFNLPVINKPASRII